MNASSRVAGRAGATTAGSATVTAPPLREQVAEALERLARVILQSSSDQAVSRNGDTPQTKDVVRFLGQVASGWAHVPDAALPPAGAGFGSTVVVEDADTGVSQTYTLMAGPMIDIDANQVSLASPIGQALLGCEPGVVVEVETPQRRRRLRVVEVRTLRDLLIEHGLDV